jgi:hypothetical protein
MTGIILYPLLTTALYYLASQALITEFLWSHYPPKLDSFMSCPACTGFWYGLLCGALGWWLRLPYLGLDPRHFATPVLIGLSSIVWTPLLSNLHTRAMTYEHSQPTEER